MRQKRVELVTVAFGHELDPAVGKVANVARNLETPGQRLAREAKPHPLNPAREMDSATIPRHELQPRRQWRPGRILIQTPLASQTFTTFHVIS